MGRIALVLDTIYSENPRVAILASFLSLVEIILFLLVTFVTLDIDYVAHVALVSSAFAVGTAREVVLYAWRRREFKHESKMLWLNLLGLVALLILIIVFLVLELGGPENQNSGIAEITLFDVLICMTAFHVVELKSLELRASAKRDDDHDSQQNVRR